MPLACSNVLPYEQIKLHKFGYLPSYFWKRGVNKWISRVIIKGKNHLKTVAEQSNCKYTSMSLLVIVYLLTILRRNYFILIATRNAQLYICMYVTLLHQIVTRINQFYTCWKPQRITLPAVTDIFLHCINWITKTCMLHWTHELQCSSVGKLCVVIGEPENIVSHFPWFIFEVILVLAR